MNIFINQIIFPSCMASKNFDPKKLQKKKTQNKNHKKIAIETEMEVKNNEKDGQKKTVNINRIKKDTKSKKLIDSIEQNESGNSENIIGKEETMTQKGIKKKCSTNSNEFNSKKEEDYLNQLHVTSNELKDSETKKISKTSEPLKLDHSSPITQLYGESTSKKKEPSKMSFDDLNSSEQAYFSFCSEESCVSEEYSSEDIDCLIAERQDANVYNEYRATLADFIADQDSSQDSDQLDNKLFDKYFVSSHSSSVEKNISRSNVNESKEKIDLGVNGTRKKIKTSDSGNRVNLNSKVSDNRKANYLKTTSNNKDLENLYNQQKDKDKNKGKISNGNTENKNVNVDQRIGGETYSHKTPNINQSNEKENTNSHESSEKIRPLKNTDISQNIKKTDLTIKETGPKNYIQGPKATADSTANFNLSLTSSQLNFSDSDISAVDSEHSSEITNFSSFLTQSDDLQENGLIPDNVENSREIKTKDNFLKDPQNTKERGLQDNFLKDSQNTKDGRFNSKEDILNIKNVENKEDVAQKKIVHPSISKEFIGNPTILQSYEKDQDILDTISMETSEISDTDIFSSETKNKSADIPDNTFHPINNNFDEQPMTKQPHTSQDDPTIFHTSFATGNKKRISINRSTYEREQRKNKETEEQE